MQWRSTEPQQLELHLSSLYHLTDANEMADVHSAISLLTSSHRPSVATRLSPIMQWGGSGVQAVPSDSRLRITVAAQATESL